MARLSESTEPDQFQSFDGAHAVSSPTEPQKNHGNQPLDALMDQETAANLGHPCAQCQAGIRPQTPDSVSSNSTGTTFTADNACRHHHHHHYINKPYTHKWRLRKVRDPAAKSWDHSGHSVADTVSDFGKGVGLVISGCLWFPICLPYDLARGCEYVPVLYGDKLAREPVHIRGAKSGVVASGQRFCFGFYDGIFGLVEQPYVGARDEGFKGFAKGCGKGLGGLVFKPMGGCLGLPSYALYGFYREIAKGIRTRHNRCCCRNCKDGR